MCRTSTRPFFAILFTLLSSQTWAATPTFVVNSEADEIDADLTDGICRTASGVCTLRAAVMQANQEGAQGAALSLPAGTYTIVRPRSGTNDDSSGDFNITNTSGLITILGAGPASTIIDANGFDRAFEADANTTLRLVGLTIKNGNATGGPSPYGGAISALSARVYLENIVLTASTASTGGCYVGTTESYLKNVTMSGCSAGYGGAMYVEGTVVVENSTFADNQTTIGDGGGVYMTVSGTLTATRSTFSGNHSASNGGGVYLGAGAQFLGTAVTIANNQSVNAGGGLYFASNVGLDSSTVSGNYAQGADHNGYGAGYFGYNSAVISIANTIFGNNSEGAFNQDCEGGVLIYAGLNRIALTTQCLSGPSPLGGDASALSDGSLGLLQDNGGPTKTVGLLAGSNAINGGYSFCEQQDQRGYARNVGACDLGAFEYGATPDQGFKDNFEVF
jgi:CSLREA domain-containing protein